MYLYLYILLFISIYIYILSMCIVFAVVKPSRGSTGSLARPLRFQFGASPAQTTTSANAVLFA